MADRLNVFFVLTLLFDHVLFLPDIAGVSVMEGDSVTLNTDAKTKQQEHIKWYFNNIRIAEISGDLSDICTDVQCEDGDERFRDRLKLDHQTGSLNIMNITNTHSGLYELKLISSSISEKIFNVTVYGVPATEQDHKSVKEGEPVTLDPGEVRNPSDVMMWYYNDILIAEISRYQSKVCEDDRCKERFRDRVEVNHQTRSLTIHDIRITDTGLYKLNIISGLRRINSGVSVKRYDVTVTGPDSVVSSGAVAGIVVAVLLLVVAVRAAVIYYRKQQAGKYEGGTRQNEAEVTRGYEMHRTYV